MAVSTKDAWLSGPSDLKEREVKDVPVKGQSVKIRALSASVANQVNTDAITNTIQGNRQVMRVDGAMLDVLKFHHGVTEPQFDLEESKKIAARFGPAFNKVIREINEISGITEEDAKTAEARFQGGDPVEASSSHENGAGASTPSGSGGSAVAA